MGILRRNRGDAAEYPGTRPPVDKVLAAHRFEIPRATLFGRGRGSRRASVARQVAIYLAHMKKTSELESAIEHLKWDIAVEILEENTRQLSQLIGAKYDPDQPRDDRGRWTDTGADQSSGGEGSDPQKILALARQ